MLRVAAPDIAIQRKALGLSQLEFGQLFGVHVMTASKWERGIAAPSAYQVALIREFEEAAAAGSHRMKSELKQMLVGRGVAAALLLLLDTAARKG
jgi:putative transcriptional regulator